MSEIRIRKAIEREREREDKKFPYIFIVERRAGDISQS